jgi:hypothetical protein
VHCGGLPVDAIVSPVKTDRLVIRFDPATRAQLAAAAQQDRRPVANLVRNVLADWLADRKATHTSKEHPRGHK